MDKAYPVIYGQQNYPDKLGTSPTATIATDGCFVTALAMKACFYGQTITPPELNKRFTDKPVYINNDLLPDNALSQVFDNIKYVKTLDYEPIPTDLNNIKTLLSDPATTITIRINRGGGNLHFVEAVACDGNTLHIANPWTGKVEDFSQLYGNPVTANLHVIVYTGTGFTLQDAPLAVRFNQAITKANNFNDVADFLGITQDQRVTTLAGQVVVEKIKQLQEEVTQLQDQNQKLVEDAQKAAAVVPTTVTTTTVVTPPVPVAPIEAPKFSDGTAPLPSSGAPTPLDTQKLKNGLSEQGFFDKIWKTITFWFG